MIERVERMTNRQKRERVAALLRDPLSVRESWSDQRIADAVGVSRNFVGKIRSEMEDAGERQPVAVRAGSDGKLYPAVRRRVEPSGNLADILDDEQREWLRAVALEM